MNTIGEEILMFIAGRAAFKQPNNVLNILQIV